LNSKQSYSLFTALILVGRSEHFLELWSDLWYMKQISTKTSASLTLVKIASRSFKWSDFERLTDWVTTALWKMIFDKSLTCLMRLTLFLISWMTRWSLFKWIIIIINSYTLVTLIRLTHEKLYAICIEWTKLSEVENHSQSTWLLHAVETVSFKTMYQICSCWLHVREWVF